MHRMYTSICSVIPYCVYVLWWQCVWVVCSEVYVCVYWSKMINVFYFICVSVCVLCCVWSCGVSRFPSRDARSVFYGIYCQLWEVAGYILRKKGGFLVILCWHSINTKVPKRVSKTRSLAGVTCGICSVITTLIYKYNYNKKTRSL